MKPYRSTSRTYPAAVCAALMLAVWAGPAEATWSIIAVDRDTGQVGIAGASCTFSVHGIGSVVPGKGVVVVQAMSSGDAREHGVELMGEGSTPEQIVAAMRAGRFDPENQQYAVVSLDPDQPPATYSGTSISQWRGALTGDGVAVQGNILVGENVLTEVMAAFQATSSKSLAERLMKALYAGAEAGGDKRCGEQAARSATLTVANADDVYVQLVVYGIDDGGENAVKRLAAQFKRWRKIGADHKSTRWFIVP